MEMRKRTQMAPRREAEAAADNESGQSDDAMDQGPVTNVESESLSPARQHESPGRATTSEVASQQPSARSRSGNSKAHDIEFTACELRSRTGGRRSSSHPDALPSPTDIYRGQVTTNARRYHDGPEPATAKYDSAAMERDRGRACGGQPSPVGDHLPSKPVTSTDIVRRMPEPRRLPDYRQPSRATGARHLPTASSRRVDDGINRRHLQTSEVMDINRRNDLTKQDAVITVVVRRHWTKVSEDFCERRLRPDQLTMRSQYLNLMGPEIWNSS